MGWNLMAQGKLDKFINHSLTTIDESGNVVKSSLIL